LIVRNELGGLRAFGNLLFKDQRSQEMLQPSGLPSVGL
jgi:hypothetical protein